MLQKSGVCTWGWYTGLCAKDSLHLAHWMPLEKNLVYVSGHISPLLLGMTRCSEENTPLNTDVIWKRWWSTLFSPIPMTGLKVGWSQKTKKAPAWRTEDSMSLWCISQMAKPEKRWPQHAEKECSTKSTIGVNVAWFWFSFGIFMTISMASLFNRGL